ncbi:Erythromycin esterase [Amycolatopsis sp. YIM 10]|nr:Erythromycin esterase [Amycolatopsis sp. YIM 10]
MTNGSLVDWIRTHGHSVAALDLDAPLDDLAPVAEIVGSARVVGLGESSHHVREFYQVRHRMLRFLVERCGFTVFAVEAPFTGSELLDDWLGGAPRGDRGGRRRDSLEPRRSAGVARRPPLVADLQPAARVRYTGVDLPGSLGSPLPALEAIAAYVESCDPDAMPTLARARELVGRFHDPAPMKVLFGYPLVDQAERDALTAALAELVARLQRLAHRRVPPSPRSVAAGPAESRTNWRLKKAPEPFGSGELFPAGYHLAAELGDGYRAIGVTSRGGRTGAACGDLTGAEGFPFQEAPLPPPEATAIESAFPIPRRGRSPTCARRPLPPAGRSTPGCGWRTTSASNPPSAASTPLPASPRPTARSTPARLERYCRHCSAGDTPGSGLPIRARGMKKHTCPIAMARVASALSS